MEREEVFIGERVADRVVRGGAGFKVRRSDDGEEGGERAEFSGGAEVIGEANVEVLQADGEREGAEDKQKSNIMKQ